MREMEKINEEIKRIFEFSNLENKKEFVKIMHFFKEDCEGIYYVHDLNPLFVFFCYSYDVCYLDGIFNPFIFVSKTKEGVNLKASDDFKRYLDTDLFLKTYHNMVNALLK